MTNPTPRQQARLTAAGAIAPERVGALPADFRFGVSTAAYQIEGAVTEGGRGPSIWDTFSHTPGLTVNGDTGDVACDHYHRWPADLDLMAGLGIRDYRLSVSWSRLQPLGIGELNSQAVAFYRAVLEGARQRGIRVLVTLYHWDLPQPLEDAGGWPTRATAERFAEYAARTVAALGDLTDDWITLNEPWCSSFLGYGYGAHAPGRRDWSAAVAAAHHLNLAHGLATVAIRTVSSSARVGIANIVTDVVPASETADDLAAAERLDAANNRLFLDPVYLGDYSEPVRSTLGADLEHVIEPGDLSIISSPTDFAGINHYQRVTAEHAETGGPLRLRERAAQPATTSFGWSVIPESLTAVLLRVARSFTSLPILITENGASFDDYADPHGDVVDTARVDYLHGYIGAVIAAAEQGVDVRGYYAWSFLDNFEWAEGFGKRFGLVFVDYPSQQRIPKLSAYWYAQLIAERLSEAETIGSSA